MEGAQQDLYRVLGVSPRASQTEISSAFRRRLREQHPDTRSLLAARDSDREGQLQRVIEAYAVLRDADRRTAYDRSRRTTPPGHPVSGGPIRVPVTYAERTGTPRPQPPLWVGPVRRHR